MVQMLRAHRARQEHVRTAAGDAWIDTDLVFTRPTGGERTPAATRSRDTSDAGPPLGNRARDTAMAVRNKIHTGGKQRPEDSRPHCRGSFPARNRTKIGPIPSHFPPTKA
jgi:hypothetical protein